MPAIYPYAKNTKIYDLHRRIFFYDDLKHLLFNNSPRKSTHLHKFITKTYEYDFLNEYIDEYLKLYSRRINVCGKDNCTLLMLASLPSNTEKTMKIILNHKPDVNCRNIKGETALILACRNSNQLNKINILLEHGSDVNAQDVNGRIAIMHCFWNYKNIYAIKIILNYTDNINIQDRHGLTILMYAIMFLPIDNMEEIVKILLSHNANIKLKNEKDQDVIDIAFKNYNYTLNYLLPNRKIYIEYIKSSNKILKMKLEDFKVTHKIINTFRTLILTM